MFIDAMKNQHNVAAPNARIVSIVPSLTELLYDLDLADQVVGRTIFCIHPDASVKNVTSIGGTKRINYSKLIELAPDYVLLNIDENPKSIADELQKRKIKTIITHPTKTLDNIDLYHLIGSIFNRVEQAEVLKAAFNTAYMELKLHADTLPKQRVLYIIWSDPWMSISANTYIADILRLIDWQVIPHKDDVRYPTFNFSDLDLNQIDLVLFSTEPYSFTQKHITAFCEQHPAHSAKAHLIDGEMLSWYGSRAIKGLNYLKQYCETLNT